MLRRTLILGLVGGFSGLLTVPALGAPFGADDLGTGRYARMAMRLEKTFLKIDVLDLSIVVSQATADALERLVKGKDYSKQLEQEVASTVVKTSDAYAGLAFLMDVDFDQFVEGGRANLKLAYDAKMITKEEYDRVYSGLPQWFRFLKERGLREGDRLQYRGSPKGLRTVYNDRKGKKLNEITHRGAAPLATMLASYFAPESDFREPLVKSLFVQQQASLSVLVDG